MITCTTVKQTDHAHPLLVAARAEVPFEVVDTRV